MRLTGVCNDVEVYNRAYSGGVHNVISTFDVGWSVEALWFGLDVETKGFHTPHLFTEDFVVAMHERIGVVVADQEVVQVFHSVVGEKAEATCTVGRVAHEVRATKLHGVDEVLIVHID